MKQQAEMTWLEGRMTLHLYKLQADAMTSWCHWAAQEQVWHVSQLEYLRIKKYKDDLKSPSYANSYNWRSGPGSKASAVSVKSQQIRLKV